MKVKLGAKKEAIEPEILDSPLVIQAKEPPSSTKTLARAIKKNVSTHLSTNDLETILRDHFPPQKINQLLIDMSNAEDTKSSSTGDLYQTPNWDVRHKTIQTILKLLGHIKNDQGMPADQIPTKIVFNVIHKQVNVENAEVTNESPAD